MMMTTKNKNKAISTRLVVLVVVGVVSILTTTVIVTILRNSTSSLQEETHHSTKKGTPQILLLDQLLSLPTIMTTTPSTNTTTTNTKSNSTTNRMTSSSSSTTKSTTLASSSSTSSVFHFIHTTSSKDLLSNKRFVRCLESVFYHHHHHHHGGSNNATTSIILHVPQDEDNIGLHTEFTNDEQRTLLGPFLDAGYNITIRPFQLKQLMDQAMNMNTNRNVKSSVTSRGSSSSSICSINHQRAQSWFNIQRIQNFMTKNWYVDVSDLVRLLILYMYGGTYLDTDVIVVKPLDNLPPNTIGYERQYNDQYNNEYEYGDNNEQRHKQHHHRFLNGEVNNAVLVNFQIGNEFVCDCLNEYFLSYKSSTFVWGYVGPRLFQREVSRSKYRRILSISSSDGAGNGANCEVSSSSLQSLAYNDDNRIYDSSVVIPFMTGSVSNHYDSCPVVILWKDAFYVDIAGNECLIPTTVEVCSIKLPSMLLLLLLRQRVTTLDLLFVDTLLLLFPHLTTAHCFLCRLSPCDNIYY